MVTQLSMCSELLIGRRKTALFKLKEFPSWENFIYKKEEAMAKSTLRKIEKEYFKKFNSINTQANLIFRRKLANLRICGIVEHNQINTKKRKL